MTWDELRAEAFGEIGLDPTDFYNMDHEDYWLKHKGFFNKRLNEYRMLRWAVSPLVASWVKEFNPYKNMPLTKDDDLQGLIRTISISEASRKRLEEFKAKESK